MKLQLIAEARSTTRRMVTKTVTSQYFLDVFAYPQGRLPTFPSVCNQLSTPIGTGVDLKSLLGAAISFNASETTLVGTWPSAWNYTSWPFAAIGYLQLWPSKPPLTGGTYRVPSPASALAVGKGFTISKSLASRRELPGKPTVTISIVGRVIFSFKRVG